MSYILDALRKSDQQRQHAKAPTLLSAQATPEAPKRASHAFRAGIAAALIGAGMLIGWLQPWRMAPPPVEEAPVAARSPVAPPSQPSALPALPDAGVSARVDPPSQPLPTLPATPRATTPPTPSRPSELAAAVSPESASAASPPFVAAEKDVLKQSELPAEVQRALPGIMIAFHQYSSAPAERRVMINNVVLHQGELIAPGLKLEQITPDGVVIGFQGYQFMRGVR